MFNIYFQEIKSGRFMNDDGKSILKSIGKGIKFWRKYEGLDQSELSKRLGTSP